MTAPETLDRTAALRLRLWSLQPSPFGHVSVTNVPHNSVQSRHLSALVRAAVPSLWEGRVPGALRQDRQPYRRRASLSSNIARMRDALQLPDGSVFNCPEVCHIYSEQAHTEHVCQQQSCPPPCSVNLLATLLRIRSLPWPSRKRSPPSRVDASISCVER